MDFLKFSMKKAGGCQDGKPCPRLIALVCLRSEVMLAQTVGLSKPLSLSAGEI